MEPSVFIATPCYDGTVHATCVQSLMQGRDLLIESGIPSMWRAHLGVCYLPVTRNKLVRSFLESVCTDLIFVDSDLEFEAGALLKLMQTPFDVVGGTYPLKNSSGNFCVRLKKSDETGLPTIDEKTGCVEAYGLPTGFLRIKRAVFEAIHEFYGDDFLKVVELDTYGNPKEEYLNFFDTGKDGTFWWGEDYNFCRLWANMGGQLWLYPNISFRHHGTAAYQGNFYDHCSQEA